MITVSIHGRGGQGVSTAISVLSKTAFSSGFYVQSIFFPAQERRGSHVWGIVKMDKNPIISKQMENPDIALVFTTNIDIKAIADTVREKGIIIFNASEKIIFPAVKKKKLKTYFVDATGIAMRSINKPIPNMAMLGAFAKYFNKISLKGIKSAASHMEKENAVGLDEGFNTVK